MNSIPTMTRHLLIINIIAFLATLLFKQQGIDLNEMLGLHFFMAKDFHVYQFLTYMFLHGGFTHILFNMFALWMFGGVIERVWGSQRFIVYYIICGIGAGLAQEIAQFCNFYASGILATDNIFINGQAIDVGQYLNLFTTIGASGAVYAVLLAFGMTFPNERLFIIPFPFPIKAKWLITGYIVIELLSSMQASHDGVAHVAHLGGMFFGYLMIRYWRSHPGSSSRRYSNGFGQDLFESFRRDFLVRKQDSRQHETIIVEPEQPTAEELEEERRRQEEVDAILDKIRKSGYDSLTADEKRRLFEQTRGR